MAGIVFRTKKTPSKDDFGVLVDELIFANLQVHASGCYDKFDFALIAPQGSASSVATHRDQFTVLVDGYFVECLGGGKSSADWFIERYLNKGFGILQELNGSFNLLVLNHIDNSIILASDRAGTRPLFYALDGNDIAICFRSALVNKLGGCPSVLNESMVANLLSYGRIIHRDQTFFENVKSFPKATVLEWKPGSGVEFKEYSVASPLGTSHSEGNVEELAEIFKEVVTDYNKVPNLGLSLSGGLDSRILLAAGFQGDTFTWGYQEYNEEILYAKMSAEENCNKWNYVNLTPEDFLDLEHKGDRIREGLDLFVQSYALNSYPRVVEQGVRGLMTGLALDFTMGGSYSPDSKSFDSSMVDGYVKKKIEVFNSEVRSKLYRSPNLHDAVEKIASEISTDLSYSLQSNSAQEVVYDFFMEQRVRRCIFFRQQWQRSYCEDYIPTFDNRIISYLNNFSLEERSGHKLYQKVLLSLSERLASIPYQGTNMPAYVPTKYWKKAAKLEAEKETLYRSIYAETNGEIFVPYNRYYSNFDEWLRTNRTWADQVNAMLLSSESRILEYINADYVRKLVEEQRNATQTHYGKIIILISLEKTLRSFF